MPVALISAVDPYPTDAGKKVVLAGFVEYFRDRLGADAVHYLMVGGRPQEQFPVILHALPKPRTLTAIGNVLARVPSGRATLQEALLRSRTVATAMQTALENIRPTLEVYDTIRMAQYAGNGHAQRQICYLDDLFSDRYRGMLVAADRYRDVEIRPLGNFAQHVPSSLQPLASNKFGQRALLRIESRLAARSENRAARTFGRSLLVNPREADILVRRAGTDHEHVHAIPPLIRPSADRPRHYRGIPEFVFLGLLSLPHNDDGLRWFLTNVWPRVIEQRPNARLRVIGREPSPALIRSVDQQADSVNLEGYVPDLSEILAGAAALLNPLRFGSGLKLKVIEALGQGIPVVSTRVGADGFVSGADEGILVAEHRDDFVRLMLELTDCVRNASVSEAARVHFLRRYSRAAVFERYDSVFGLA